MAFRVLLVFLLLSVALNAWQFFSSPSDKTLAAIRKREEIELQFIPQYGLVDSSVREKNLMRRLADAPRISEVVTVDLSTTLDSNAAVITLHFIDGRTYSLWLDQGVTQEERKKSFSWPSGSPTPNPDPWPTEIASRIDRALVRSVSDY